VQGLLSSTEPPACLDGLKARTVSAYATAMCLYFLNEWLTDGRADLSAIPF